MKKPVIVFVYGGGFSGGSPALPVLDGGSWALRDDVVVVSVPYRVGVFGLLAHAELSKETGHGSGTWALQDVLAGLKWVNENIEKFGGDAQNITLWGQSSGATAAQILAMAPPARGLFQRIVSQSGGALVPARRLDQPGSLTPSLRQGEKDGADFFARLNVSSLGAARAKSPEDVLKAATGLFWPVADGYMVFDNPKQRYGEITNHVDILAGWNADDALFPASSNANDFIGKMNADYGSYAPLVLAQYRHSTPQETERSGRDIQRDLLFAWPSYALARTHVEFTRNKVYLYHNDGARNGRPNGAGHGAEAFYLFDNGRIDEKDTVVARQMRTYLMNFVRTGNPNRAGLTTWPVYDRRSEQLLNFDPLEVRTVPNRATYQMWNGYYESLGN